MQMNIYALKDLKADDVMGLHIHHKDIIAYRMFDQTVRSWIKQQGDVEGFMFYNYEDFALYRVGIINMDTLEIWSEDKPVRVLYEAKEGI